MKNFLLGDRVRIVKMINQDGQHFNGCEGVVTSNDKIFIEVTLEPHFLNENVKSILSTPYAENGIVLVYPEEIELI